jgi:thiol-disulfide isomerase/thioredoxin
MKKLLFILSAFLASCSITDPYYLDLRNSRQNELNILKIDTSDNFNKNNPLGVYAINSKEFLSILNKSTVKYKIVIFFTNWCPNSAQSVPVLLDSLKNKEELEIFMISPDDWIRKPNYLGYQRKHNLNLNIYLLDVYSYGEKRNPHYRMEKFISEICSDCKEIMGFPSFLVFDRENSVIFKHSGKLEVNRLNTILKI